MTREQHRATYAAKRAEGVCVECGHDSPERARCANCRAKRRRTAHTRRRTHSRAVVRHLLVSVGNEPIEPLRVRLTRAAALYPFLAPLLLEAARQ